MSEVKYAMSIIRGKLKNADEHNLHYQRFSIADMEAILGVLSKSESDYAALQQKLDALVGLVENVDNSHCMCGAEIDKKYGYGCGYTTGMFDYHYGKWAENLRSGTHDTADKAGAK